MKCNYFLRLPLVWIISFGFTEAGAAQGSNIQFINPNSLKYIQSPTGNTYAMVIGNIFEPGNIYVFIAKYAAGQKSIPHTHPDQHIMTVISGTFYAGIGPEFDEKTLKPLSAGSILVIPANTLHYGWAKDGEVVIQETGIGPTGTKIWPKSQ